LRIQIAKVEDARFLSHLELYSAILRAMRRSEIPFRFSKGHHPLPKITFSPALPLGIESQAEYIDLEVFGFLKENQMVSKINDELPKGISIIN